MKRYIRTGWYTGEPSNFATTRSGRVRSYYSDPKNWREKQALIRDAVRDYSDVKCVGSTPWVMKYDLTGHGDIFTFDLWEDDASIDEQIAMLHDLINSLDVQ